MKEINSPKIILVEDHHEAYYAWKERKFKNLPLVHLDAHVDFEFQEVKPERLILQEARTVTELKTQLEKALLFKKYKFGPEELTDIGNYIYPAMRDGIVGEFFWIVPGGLSEFQKCLGRIKKALSSFQKEDPFADNGASFGPGFVRTQLYHKSFYICTLKALPKMKNPVLLDIDTDFLVTDSLKNEAATRKIGKRKPWILPDELVGILKNKVPAPKFITIAYSVNQGFTPMVYKAMADQIARSLGCSDPNIDSRILAGEYFKKFRESLDKEDYRTAKSYYFQALKLNPKYRVPDNNYGPLYLQSEDFAQAEKEFRRMLKVDAEDSYALSGLGRIYFAKKRFKVAHKYFKQAFALKHDNKAALIGRAETEYMLKNFPAAKIFLARYEKLEPLQSASRYVRGLIHEKEGHPQKAYIKYKEALQLGLSSIDLLIKLVKLANRFAEADLDYLKIRFADYKKRFYKFDRKGLQRKGNFSHIRRMEEKIKRLSASLGR
jgi:tetratricopeptide (TPR) repeat protein